MLFEDKRGPRSVDEFIISDDGDGVAVQPDRFDILVVEDDKVLGDLLSDLLRREGYRVSTAGHGEGALALLSSHDVGLVILDLMLPVMTGWELYECLKESARLRDVPVFVMTAFQNLSRAQAIGPVFLKPLNVPSLLRAVHMQLDTAR